MSCDLLKIHYLCGDKDNARLNITMLEGLWFAQNSLPLRWQRQRSMQNRCLRTRCDLLKIHYLCGDKDNEPSKEESATKVVICSKFITFAVTKTTEKQRTRQRHRLWFAQNSLPLRWQRQLYSASVGCKDSCDLLKIHYLCGDKDNINSVFVWESEECRMY